MMTMTKLMMMLLIMNFTFKKSNPVKISFILILTGALIMMVLSFLSGSTWFPMIFYLLFMGGIMMMFMILSSLMPNEPMKKTKKFMIYSIILSSTTPLMMMMTNENLTSFNLKMICQSNSNTYIIVTIILIYFLSFIFVISKNKMSMRSTMCR